MFVSFKPLIVFLFKADDSNPVTLNLHEPQSPNPRSSCDYTY